MDNGAENYRRFLAGDETGLDEILHDYKDGLIFYINTIVGNIYDAEDIAIDTFALLGIKKPKDKNKSSFKTWLYTIGRTLAIDHLRKNKKKAEIPLDEVAELSDDKDEMLMAYVKTEQNVMLHKSMERLKAEYRQILWLIYFEGLSYKQASVIMKKSVNATEVLASRARKELKAQLEREGFEYEGL